MPRRINGPQNKEQLQLMVEAVRGEVNLAQDLLNSYEQDLADLEANTTMSEIDKNSRRVFLETAIKESKAIKPPYHITLNTKPFSNRLPFSLDQ